MAVVRLTLRVDRGDVSTVAEQAKALNRDLIYEMLNANVARGSVKASEFESRKRKIDRLYDSCNSVRATLNVAKSDPVVSHNL